MTATPEEPGATTATHHEDLRQLLVDTIGAMDAGRFDEVRITFLEFKWESDPIMGNRYVSALYSGILEP